MEVPGESRTSHGHSYMAYRKRLDRLSETDPPTDPSSIGIADPTRCLDACYYQFIYQRFENIHGQLDLICNTLLQDSEEADKMLWSLYCCDSQNCGTETFDKGTSHSVDLIINTCQDIGYHGINDPGPNKESCPSESYDGGQSRLPPSPSPEESELPKSDGERTIPDHPTMTSMNTNPPMTSAPLLSSTQPAAAAPATASSTAALSSAASQEEAATGLSAESKAAIGVCSSLAVIALIFLAVFIICRRRGLSRSYPRAPSAAPRHSRSFSEPASVSRTPLISPPPSAGSRDALSLTAPARLSDRKFLIPSILKQGRLSPGSGLSEGIDLAFPASPVFAPSSNKLFPRHERRVTTSSIKFALSPHPPPPPPTASASSSHYARNSSLSSLSSGPGTSTVTVVAPSNKASSVHSSTTAATVMATGGGISSPPLSPTRPPRPHDGPLEIPDLVTPAGPPPNRALPPPPQLYQPSSPTFSVSPLSATSPTFPTRPIVLGGSSPVISIATPPRSYSSTLPRSNNPYHSSHVHTHPYHHATTNPSTPNVPSTSDGGLDKKERDKGKEKFEPVSATELRELTQAYARESWGSWSGAPGGVSPPVGARRNRGSDGATSSSRVSSTDGTGSKKGVPLQDLDLERLGGRYRGQE
ncbi:hypothetical protein F4778DRAFT_266017 [Xylariomycetidae sp. FL2044]|nr:hypothetical protein F4778DRAFT_266017 [Xylariomycetidae sp. FL2044]